MDVILPPDLERFVLRKVGDGHFLTEVEVICEGLRLLQRDEELDRLKLEEMRTLVAVGLEQAGRGEVAPLDMAAVRAEGRRRLARTGNEDHPHVPSPADGAGVSRPG